jgi:DNA-binding NtrC family response regulator
LYPYLRKCQGENEIPGEKMRDKGEIQIQNATKGIVWELVNSVESALVVAYQDPILLRKHMPTSIRVKIAKEHMQRKEEVVVTLSESREKMIEKHDAEYIRNVAFMAGGDINKMCEIAALGKTRMYEIVKKYSIDIQSETSLFDTTVRSASARSGISPVEAESKKEQCKA